MSGPTTTGSWDYGNPSDEGDWLVYDKASNLVLARTYEIVEYGPPILRADAEANARIMAVAPEMLDVLEAIDEWLDNLTLGVPRCSRQSIKDVINKACGLEATRWPVTP